MKETLKKNENILRKVSNLSKLVTLLFASFLISVPNASAEGNKVSEIEETLQQKEIKGKVLDNAGEALIGVSVLEKGTTNGTVTDLDGNFSLKVKEGATLVISYVGYSPQEVKVGAQTDINITLSEDTKTLDEVVVVAYGATRKKDLTGALSSLDPEKMTLQSTSTVTKALEGSAPGLQISSLDGQPGLDAGIRIRGVGSTSVDASAALVVIDGVPAQMDNPLSTLNPNDIANVSILKDAASTALYGSRGANGVVLITTKKGKAGKTNIQFSSRWGFNSVGPFDADRIDKASDYYEFVWKSIYNSYRYGDIATGKPYATANGSVTSNVQNPNYSHDQAALYASQNLFSYGGVGGVERNNIGNYMAYNVPGAQYHLLSNTTTAATSTMSGAYLVNPDGKINPAAQLLYNDTYADELLTTAFRQEYNLSASGGTDKVDYFLSLSYLDDPSYIKNSSFSRYSGRSSINAQLYKWLKVGANVGYTRTSMDQMATTWGSGRNGGAVQGNVFRFIKGTAPVIPVYARNEDGSLNYNKTTGTPYTSIAGSTWSPLGETARNYGGTDIIYAMENDIYRTKVDLWNTRIYANFDIYDGLSLLTNLSIDQNNTMRTRYANPLTGRGASDQGGMSKNSYGTRILNTQQLLNYNKDFDKHHLDAMLGHEYDQWSQDMVRWGAGYAFIPGFLAAANFLGKYVNTSGYDTPSYSTDLRRLESYLGRANYIYDSKYYASVSARMDGSSKFRNDRWGTFWSVGGGWRPSEEAFMKDTRTWLDNLKIRASYGVIGNQNAIGNYSGYQTWGYSTSYTTVSNGTGRPTGTSYKLSPGAMADSSLTWEKTKTFDVGIDASFLNRFHVTLDYYNRYTDNSFFDQPISYLATGQWSVKKNIAGIQNRGFELELSADVIKNKDLTWNVAITGTTYSTKLTSLPEFAIPESVSGQPAGTWTSKADSWAAAGGTDATAGTFYLRGVGRDWYNIYLYKYAGADPETGVAQYWHNVSQQDLDNGKYAGHQVGDDVKTSINSEASRYEVGNAIPDWIGGLTTTLRYKGFDLQAVLAYQLGGKIYSVEYGNHLYRSVATSASATGISKELIGNTWTPENPNAKFPMQWYDGTNAAYIDGTQLGSELYTDMALFSASYLRVKNITLGYTLPQNITNRLQVGSLRVYVAGDNLFMASAKKGLDPSMSLTGGFEVRAFTYPAMRTMSFGLNLTL